MLAMTNYQKDGLKHLKGYDLIMKQLKIILKFNLNIIKMLVLL